jgi:hypothetical protein
VSTHYYTVARPAGQVGLYGKVAVLVAAAAVGGFLARGVDQTRIEVGQSVAAVRSADLPAMDAGLGFWDVIDTRPAISPAVADPWYSGQSGNGLSIAENQSDYGSAALGMLAGPEPVAQSEMGDFQFAPVGAATQRGPAPIDEALAESPPTDPLWYLREQLDFRG